MTVNVKIPEKMDSKFRFVLVAAHRAEQLMRGARAHEGHLHRKPTTVAQHEVADGLIGWEYTQPLADEVAAEEALAAEAEDEEEAAMEETVEDEPVEAAEEDEEDVN